MFTPSSTSSELPGAQGHRHRRWIEFSNRDHPYQRSSRTTSFSQHRTSNCKQILRTSPSLSPAFFCARCHRREAPSKTRPAGPITAIHAPLVPLIAPPISDGSPGAARRRRRTSIQPRPTPHHTWSCRERLVTPQPSKRSVPPRAPVDATLLETDPATCFFAVAPTWTMGVTPRRVSSAFHAFLPSAGLV
jgi:hypothetical protein